jgi:hypothetical protein
MAPVGEASPMWRAIEPGVELLKHGVIKRIGDGESIQIWRDNWILRQPNLKPSGATRTCRLRRVSQLMRPGCNEWDVGILRRFFYPWDADDILKIKLPAIKTQDWVVWNYENSGVFLVRSTYRLALMRATNMDELGSSSERGGERKVWLKIWKMPVLPKVRNFIWKMVQNRLPMNENRRYRHIADDASCELCYYGCEDTFHVIMDCPHAKALRMAMREVWALPTEERLHNVGPEWFLVLLDSCKEDVMANLATIMWRAWSVRNKVMRAREALSDDSVAYSVRLGHELQGISASTGLSHKGSTRERLGDQRKEARVTSRLHLRT